MSKRPLLVYCAYPIIDQDKEPSWVATINYVMENNNLEGISLYRPFYSIESQSHIHNLLEKETDNQELDSLMHLMRIEANIRPDNLKMALDLENRLNYSKNLVMKELWVLSKADIVVADCDASDRGDRDMALMVGRLLNLPIIGVANKFITGPWLAVLTNSLTSTINLADNLKALAYQIWQAEAQEEPVKVEEAETEPEKPKKKKTKNGL